MHGMTYSDNIELFNAALVGVGEEPISLNDGSAFSDLYNARFEPTVLAQLKRHKVGFAKKTATLVKQGTTGDTPKYAYQQPPDMVSPIKVTLSETRVLEYQQRGGKIVTDIDSAELVLHYVWNVPISLWPPDFAEAMLHRLQQLIYAFLERAVESREMRLDADRLFDIARVTDRNAESGQRRNERSPIIEAHLGARSR